jgi:hypothetical protein
MIPDCRFLIDDSKTKEYRIQNRLGNWKLVIGNWKLQNADGGKR